MNNLPQAPEWVKTIADARRYWAERAAADMRVRAERRARGEPAPAPASAAEQRVGAADRARHEQYGRAELLLRQDVDAADLEDAKQWDAERREQQDRTGASEAFHYAAPEET